MSNDTATPTAAGGPATAATKPLGGVVSIDRTLVQAHFEQVVRTP